MSRFTHQIVHTLQRHQGLLIILSVGLVALPFVGLSFYNHPSLDDILDAVTVKELGFWQAQKYFYLTLTGRYTTTVLLALVNPLLYGRLEASWWWVALVFIFGTFLVLRYCFAPLLGLSGVGAWRLAGAVLALWLAYAPGQGEGLYWFTGAYTYIASAWLLLLWLAVLGRYAAARQAGTSSRGWRAGLLGLTIAVAGTTEPVALPFVVALVAGAGLSWWRGWGWGWVPAVLAGVAIIGGAVSLMAPGNFVRMATMASIGEPFGFVKTLVYSAGTTGYLLLTWVGNPVLLAISALLLPMLYRVGRQRNQWLVTFLARVPPGMLAVGLGLLLTAASCPAYYASGTGLPLRARTTLYLLFLVGWLGLLLTWCCQQAPPVRPSPLLTALATGRLAPLWTGLLVLFFFADFNVQTRASMLGQGSNNVVRAYQQWLGGEAARYDTELRARYHLLQTGGPTARFPPLHNRPDLLFSFDVVDDKTLVVPAAYAHYFEVKQPLSTGAAH